MSAATAMGLVKSAWDRIPEVSEKKLILTVIERGQPDPSGYDNSMPGYTPPSPSGGGEGNPTPDNGQYAAGGEFTVPPGYPNDSYRVRASSGERVVVMNNYNYNLTAHYPKYQDPHAARNDLETLTMRNNHGAAKWAS
jgi:hypothetical protein